MGVQVQAQAQRKQRKLSTLDEDGEDGLFSRLSMAVRSLADRRRSAAYYDENGSMASGSVIGADAGLGGGQLRLQKRECMDGKAGGWDKQVQQFVLTSGGVRKATHLLMRPCSLMLRLEMQSSRAGALTSGESPPHKLQLKPFVGIRHLLCRHVL